MKMNDIKHVLYADDDNDDLEMFEEAVTKISDMSLMKARDGRELIKSLNELPVPQFILLDMYMQFHDARSCIKAIRNLRRFDNVPVMVYSTVIIPELEKQCKVLGADYFITKPSNFAEILRLVYDISIGTYKRNDFQKEELMSKVA